MGTIRDGITAGLMYLCNHVLGVPTHMHGRKVMRPRGHEVFAFTLWEGGDAPSVMF
jgi:hypothetical protein